MVEYAPNQKNELDVVNEIEWIQDSENPFAINQTYTKTNQWSNIYLKSAFFSQNESKINNLIEYGPKSFRFIFICMQK